MKKLMLFYRRVISPFLHVGFGAHGGCRFQPTCSEFAEEAIAHMGLFRGGFRALKRILRCHPFSRGGYDPVISTGR